ncbi:MAG: hypothetical protein AAGI66_08510, partial [Cyanobacteria bacterium P01_H01_bin.74]
MNKFYALLFEVLAIVMALASPIVVIHWLLSIINIRFFKPLVAALQPTVEPFNIIFQSLIQLPPIQYNNAQYPTTQGGVAVVLLIGFMACSFFAELFKSRVQAEAIKKSQQVKKARLAKIKQTNIETNALFHQQAKVILYYCYDSRTCPKGEEAIQAILSKQPLTVLPNAVNGSMFVCASIHQAIVTSLAIKESLMAFYATLRPIDAQPPLYLAVHAGLMSSDKRQSTLDELTRYTKFASDNQLLITEPCKKIMEAGDIIRNYQLLSMGFFSVGTGAQQVELFNLVDQKN